MEDVHIIEVTEENLERCQPLCDALMEFAEKSKLHREILAATNFETDPASFSPKQITLLAEYRGKAIGYAYANPLMTEEGRYFLPD